MKNKTKRNNLFKFKYKDDAQSCVQSSFRLYIGFINNSMLFQSKKFCITGVYTAYSVYAIRFEVKTIEITIKFNEITHLNVILTTNNM